MIHQLPQVEFDLAWQRTFQVMFHVVNEGDYDSRLRSVRIGFRPRCTWRVPAKGEIQDVKNRLVVYRNRRQCRNFVRTSYRSRVGSGRGLASTSSAIRAPASKTVPAQYLGPVAVGGLGIRHQIAYPYSRTTPLS